MVERIKTLLLLLLIALTARLTVLNFYGTHAATSLLVAPGPPAAEEVIDDPIPTTYIDFFSPFYILAHQRDEHYRVYAGEKQYERLWGTIKNVFAEYAKREADGSPVFTQITAHDWEAATENAYEYRFAGPIDLNFWWTAAGQATELSMPFGSAFNRLLLPFQGGGIYWQNTYTGSHWHLAIPEMAGGSLPDPGSLSFASKQKVREIRLPATAQAATATTLYAANGTVTLSEVLVHAPITEGNKDAIVKNYFGIVPRVHKAEVLANGIMRESYITARQQVLTLQSDGLLQYSEKPVDPEPGTRLLPTEQFEQAVNFIVARGGWPKGAVSAGVRALGNGQTGGYRFTFRCFLQDLPVVYREPTLQADAYPGGVGNLQKNIYTLLQPGYFLFEVRSPENALAQMAQVLAGRRISELYLAYYQRPFFATVERPFFFEPMYLYPVWVAELTSGEQLLINAYKLLNDPGLIEP